MVTVCCQPLLRDPPALVLEVTSIVVCTTGVFVSSRNAPPLLSGGVLFDGTKKGCVAD